jgi:hypothetical protein
MQPDSLDDRNAPPRGMGRGAVVPLLAVAAIGCAVAIAPTRDGGVPRRTELSARAVELRDEAIRNLGWVAGNAQGRPEWPRIRDKVDKDGTYTKAWLRISSGRMPDLAEASANLRLYEEWRAIGARAPWRPDESVARLLRVNGIATEFPDALKATR